MQNAIIAKNKTSYNAIVNAMHVCKQNYIVHVLNNCNSALASNKEHVLLANLACLSADIVQINALLAQFAVTKNVEELADGIYRTDEHALTCIAIDFFTRTAYTLCNDFQNGEYSS